MAVSQQGKNQTEYLSLRYPNEIKKPNFHQITNKYPYINLTPSEEDYLKRKSKLLTDFLNKKVSPSRLMRFLAFYDPNSEYARKLLDEIEQLKKENAKFKEVISNQNGKS